MKQDHPRQAQDMRQDTLPDRPQDALDRISVPQAANRLGITQDAVRKRIARGTIRHDKDHEGRIYVYVDPSEMSPQTRGGKARNTSTGQSRDEVLEAYRDQVEFLRRELERKDTLLMSLMQRIPELRFSATLGEEPEVELALV
jgi:hypothetical protein